MNSREIRFRTWDIKNKKFTAIRQDDVVSPEDDVMDIFRYGCDEGYIFLQFTGLKDKNGKEIYEGDIFKSLPYVYQVVYRDDRFLLIWHGKESEKGTEIKILELKNNTHLERIGNIFENPDLLVK